MLKLKVTGMTCSHCAAAVTRALRAIPSVEDVAVDLEHGDVIVRGNPDPGAVRGAIVEEGYGVVGAP
jgi:copper chaperone